MLACVSALRGELSAFDVGAVSNRSLASLAYLILFGSVLTFACYSYLLKHVRTDMVATHVFVNPLVAVALGIWLAGEQLRVAHFASGVLILASVCLITLRLRRTTAAASS
jgi:drug/metabolite transporter (DMT)-like permease